MLKKRYLSKNILQDLKQKMVFLGGPRQVGKTTFAREFISTLYKNPGYYNWDFRKDRRDIVAGTWKGGIDLLILDEVHKYSNL